jgi:hypothetical protein
MQSRDWASVTLDVVLDFWLPEDGHETDLDAHRASLKCPSHLGAVASFL